MTTKMAAPVTGCQIYNNEIKSKNYRSLTSYTSLERWGDLYKVLNIRPTGLSCSQCTNKLNRASNIAADVKLKVEKLEIERQKTISNLRDLPGVQAMLKHGTTPRSSAGKSVKRPCSLRSPSGVTPKSKRTLFLTPKKTVITFKTPVKVRTTSEMGTQTKLQVNNIKKELDSQGANKSFESAKTIAMTTQVVDSIKQQLIRTTRTARSKGDRPAVDKSKDVHQMVMCIRNQGLVKELTWPSFSMFKDPIQCLDADDLHLWINQNKKIANMYMNSAI